MIRAETCRWSLVLALVLVAVSPLEVSAAPKKKGEARKAFAEKSETPSKADLVKILKEIDDRLGNPGDYKAVYQVLEKKKGVPASAFELNVFRRDETDQLMLLFTKPRRAAGVGYLRIDNNMWSYDASVGRWERRTRRATIGATNTYEQDYDISRLARDYVPSFEGEGRVRDMPCTKLLLKAKDEANVVFPTVRLCVDDNNNVIKREEYALSGKLMRTTYIPEYDKVYSPDKKGDMWFPPEIVEYDEVDKDHVTVVRIKKIEPGDLRPNMFTKAWLESRSR